MQRSFVEITLRNAKNEIFSAFRNNVKYIL